MCQEVRCWDERERSREEIPLKSHDFPSCPACLALEQEEDRQWNKVGPEEVLTALGICYSIPLSFRSRLLLAFFPFLLSSTAMSSLSLLLTLSSVAFSNSESPTLSALWHLDTSHQKAFFALFFIFNSITVALILCRCLPSTLALSQH